MRRNVIPAALLASVSIAACGVGPAPTTPRTTTTPSTGTSATTATIGVGNSTEQHILGQIYAQQLESSGFKVTVRQNLGSPAAIDKLLSAGKIDVSLEDIGAILSTIPKQSLSAPLAGETPEGAAVLQIKTFETTRGLFIVDDTDFSDAETIAVLTSYAKQHDLASIADLGKLGRGVTLAGDPGSLSAATRTYNLDPTVEPLGSGSPYTALGTGRADAVEVSNADPQLASGKYQALSDPDFAFGVENVQPVANDKFQAGPFDGSLNGIANFLTTSAMRTINADVYLRHESPASAAAKFVAQVHAQIAANQGPGGPPITG